MKIVRLKSGSFEGQETVSEDGNSLDKPAMLVYAGKFLSMDGEVDISDGDIDKLSHNHNSILAKLSRLATGSVPLKHAPPIQLDHSTSARDTVGRLVGEIKVGEHTLEDGTKVKALYGNARVLGKENVEKVRDGRWSHLSIGADLEKHTITELTITPFPAAAEASLLSKNRLTKKLPYMDHEIHLSQSGQKWIWVGADKCGSDESESGAVVHAQKAIRMFSETGGTKDSLKENVALPGKVDEALWEKAKQASQEAFGEIRWPFVNWWYQDQGGQFHKTEASMGLKELREKMGMYEKCKKHLMESEKLSDEDADKKLEAMDDESVKKMSAERDEHDKKLAAEEVAKKEDEQKRMGALKDHKDKLIKMSKGMKAIHTNVALTKRKSDIRLRLAKVRASQKITPAEIKTLNVDELAGKSEDAIEAVLKSYEARQPVIDVGLLGSTKALSAAQLQGQLKTLKLQREELETRLNMPSKAEEARKRIAALAEEEKSVQVHIDNVPQGTHTDEEYEKMWTSHHSLMMEGKHDEAKEKLKSYCSSIAGPRMAEGAPVEDSSVEMSALAEEVKTMQTDFDEIVKLSAPVFGVTAEELA